MGCDSLRYFAAGSEASFGFHMVSVHSFKHTRMHAGNQQMFCVHFMEEYRYKSQRGCGSFCIPVNKSPFR